MNLVSGKSVTASSSYLPQAAIPIAPGAQDNCCIVGESAKGIEIRRLTEFK